MKEALPILLKLSAANYPYRFGNAIHRWSLIRDIPTASRSLYQTQSLFEEIHADADMYLRTYALALTWFLKLPTLSGNSSEDVGKVVISIKHGFEPLV